LQPQLNNFERTLLKEIKDAVEWAKRKEQPTINHVIDGERFPFSKIVLKILADKNCIECSPKEGSE